MKPVVYAYNKYGDLLDKDLRGVSFSCSPEIGHITDEGNFVGSEVAGTGTLTAEYNGVKLRYRFLWSNLFINCGWILFC